MERFGIAPIIPRDRQGERIQCTRIGHVAGKRDLAVRASKGTCRHVRQLRCDVVHRHRRCLGIADRLSRKHFDFVDRRARAFHTQPHVPRQHWWEGSLDGLRPGDVAVKAEGRRIVNQDILTVVVTVVAVGVDIVRCRDRDRELSRIAVVIAAGSVSPKGQPINQEEAPQVELQPAIAAVGNPTGAVAIVPIVRELRCMNLMPIGVSVLCNRRCRQPVTLVREVQRGVEGTRQSLRRGPSRFDYVGAGGGRGGDDRQGRCRDIRTVRHMNLDRVIIRHCPAGVVVQVLMIDGELTRARIPVDPVRRLRQGVCA